MRLLSILVVSVLVFLVYIIYTGSVSAYDIVSGIVVSLIVGGLLSTFTINNPLKTLDPRRWAWLIAFSIYYFFIAEVAAHLDVMYRILHPSMPVRPGIVMVPYTVETDYAVTAVANSITNTPGTVVVDIDPEGRKYYVHWIWVKTSDPDEARRMISYRFEYFARRVFD